MSFLGGTSIIKRPVKCPIKPFISLNTNQTPALGNRTRCKGIRLHCLAPCLVRNFQIVPRLNQEAMDAFIAHHNFTITAGALNGVTWICISIIYIIPLTSGSSIKDIDGRLPLPFAHTFWWSLHNHNLRSTKDNGDAPHGRSSRLQINATTSCARDFIARGCSQWRGQRLSARRPHAAWSMMIVIIPYLLLPRFSEPQVTVPMIQGER